MSCIEIVGLVVLLFATSVAGTGNDDDSTECVSQKEFAAVKTEMERRVDQLNAKLHYWQNVTVNTLKDHCSSINTAGERSHKGTGDTVLVSTVFNITQRMEGCSTDSVRNVLQKEFSQYFPPGYTANHPASSCKEILQLAPQSPSGLYWISGTNNRSQNVYCDMERSCKGVAGGWMRLASINMTDNSSTCPSGLMALPSPRRRCASINRTRGCHSTVFSLEGIEYSQVCGKIIGYQDETPDGFHQRFGGHNNIESFYVDGISITHGQSPRKHIWTFVVALHEYNDHADFVCPCTNTRNTPPPPTVPSFVGNDYFCDTGSENSFQYIFYEDDPLWDGTGCGEYSTCCSFNSPPWFRKQLTTPTSDDIEMRMCTDEDRGNEDINFETLELYVQ